MFYTSSNEIPQSQVVPFEGGRHQETTTTKKKNGFTLIELLIVVAIIALLVSILAPSLQRAREQAKVAYCLHNLHSLNQAWIMYADESKDRLMNGRTSRIVKISESPLLFDWQPNSYPTWVGWWDGDQLDENAQKACLELGLLFPYCKKTEFYLCPAHQPGEEWRTYSIVDSMNGYDSVDGGEVIKKLGNIAFPEERLVFIDEGYATTESWTIYANRVEWWDRVPLRHGEGTTVSLADGHSEQWMWNDERTVLFSQGQMDPVTAAQNNPDFKKIQRAVWGRYCGP